jgi:hypothetical protein
MQDKAYQEEYDKARAELDAAAEKKTVTTESQEKPKEEPVKEDSKEPVTEPDPIEKLTRELESTRKALNDTKAWGTKNAQALRELERQRELQQREAERPKILEANPELEAAIRHVTSDPRPQIEQEQSLEAWKDTVNRAIPDIEELLNTDEEFKQAVIARKAKSENGWADPLEAIRDMTAEIRARDERIIAKRFLAESKKISEKTAMSVPSEKGKTSVAPNDDDAEVKRIKNMSPSEFAREVKRVKGI